MPVFDPNLADMALRALGVCGFLIYIGLYAGLQFGLLNGDTNLYSMGSIAAASCVLISLGVDWNLSSALIQVSWIAIGLFAIARRLRRRRNGPHHPA